MHNITPKKIIKVARSWIGTKFQHQGRIKNMYSPDFNTTQGTIINGGTDCLGLIIGIAKELNLKSKIGIPICDLDNRSYNFTIQNDELYERISEYLYEADSIKPKVADIICFKIQNHIKHIAIFSYKNNIIHVTQETGQVIEHLLTEYWAKRIVAVFHFSEVSF